MKHIAAINTAIPSVENYLEYLSSDSIRDYDVAVFDPVLPYLERINFSGGGSCISIEGTKRIQSAIAHWNGEMRDALKAGKTIFIMMNGIQDDAGATDYSQTKGQRNYITTTINNYSSVPVKIEAKNSKGRQITALSPLVKGLYGVIKDIVQYQVVISSSVSTPLFATKDGNCVGGLIQVAGLTGSVVLLPYFNLAELDEDEDDWSKDAVKKSRLVVSQLIAIDVALRKAGEKTPSPSWVDDLDRPRIIQDIETNIAEIDGKIQCLEESRLEKNKYLAELAEFGGLLYENGTNLEKLVERSLKLIGYEVENIRIGDLEIDHVITNADGLRMIGESEGKDSSAIDISKFRQLESNINEDFQREDVDVPARGIIFGNGFRFLRPSERGAQFTQKCLTNAKRLNTALVRTMDLYDVVLYLIDHQDDDTFKIACRQAIEGSFGAVVIFPSHK